MDLATLYLKRKFLLLYCFLLCLILYLRTISMGNPPGTYIRRVDLAEAFLRYGFEGLIHVGAS